MPTKQLHSELKVVFDEILRETNTVTLYWHIWRKLFAVSAEQIDTLNQTAAGFFHVVQMGLRDLTFLSLSRLTDPLGTGKQGNLSLHRLLPDDRSEHESLFRDGLLQLIGEVCRRAESIRAWRNKKLAHLDYEMAVKSTRDSMPGISLEEIDETLVALQSVVNYFSKYYFDTTHYFGLMITNGGPDRLLHHLKVALETRDKELKRKLEA